MWYLQLPMAGAGPAVAVDDVYGVPHQHVQGDDLQGLGVRGSKEDGGRVSCPLRLRPPAGTQTPPVPRPQTREIVLLQSRNIIIGDTDIMLIEYCAVQCRILTGAGVDKSLPRDFV